ncbi:MAG: peptidylprolyl isomerase [Turicibacter sp.]|nr:peptidylprolyl isomerase [Turicibacter sp.]
MEVAGFGDITLELYPEYAPETVANFLGLVESGFYDGLTFHRIIDGFMIQGGDPDGNGTGGSGENIVGEFSANGHDNPLLHERGTISMARNMVSMDSASSQFFIMHQTGAFLDGDYAAFGRVIEGIEVVDAIVEAATAGQNGAVAPADQPVITRMVIE